MTDSVRIEGLEQAYAVLKDYPERVNRIVLVAMRKAVAPLTKEMRNNTPFSAWKKMIKAKKVRSTEGVALKTGIWGGKSGGEPPEWFKAYWLNYGTSERRYTGHTFVTPVKKGVKRRGVGIPPRLFFERATEGKEEAVARLFEELVVSEAQKLVDGK